MLIFVYLFTAASFNYYLINFYLKYIPGNVFINTIVSSASSATACYLSGLIIVKFGSSFSLRMSFGLCTFAGIILFIAESSSDDSNSDGPSPLIPVAVLAA